MQKRLLAHSESDRKIVRKWRFMVVMFYGSLLGVLLAISYLTPSSEVTNTASNATSPPQ
jgi:hypothetical protein